MRRAISWLLVLIAVGCAEKEECGRQQFDGTEDRIRIGVNAELSRHSTKTSMSESSGKYHIVWSDGDAIGMYVDGRQSNVYLSCPDGKSGMFSGYMKNGYPSGENVEYVCYYPYRNSCSDGKVSALLGRIQTAPFDSTLDYMVSAKRTDSYNEAGMSSLSFDFSNHLFSIVEISVTNEDETLKDERLSAVMLSSDQAVLSGYFSFSPLADDCRAVFSDDAGAAYKEVVSVYPEEKRPVLGVGVMHKLCCIVNCTEVPDLKVTVSTTDGKARVFSVKEPVTLERNVVIRPAPLCLSMAENIIDHKIMALWGDSITAALTYRFSIQRELEPFWTVVKCGVNGDNSLGIAARQGGVDFITGREFTVENGVDAVKFGGFFTGEDMFGNSTDESGAPMLCEVSFSPWFTHELRAPWINPIRLYLGDGYLDCETSYSNGVYSLVPVGGSGTAYPVTVPARTRFSSYGARALACADMTVIYTGTNGGYRGNVDGSGHYTGYDRLVRQQTSMVNHLENKSNYLVLGYHFKSTTLTEASIMKFHTGLKTTEIP